MEGDAPIDNDIDAVTVALGDCDEDGDTVAVLLEVSETDEVLVGDAVTAAGANAIL